MRLACNLQRVICACEQFSLAHMIMFPGLALATCRFARARGFSNRAVKMSENRFILTNSFSEKLAIKAHARDVIFDRQHIARVGSCN